MEVRAGGTPGRTHQRDQLAAVNARAVGDQDLGQVAIARRDALAVIDLDQIAVAAAAVGMGDDAVGGGIDRGADGTGNVDAGMHRRGAAERVGADAEVAGELQIGDRLDRGDRDRPLLQAVHLLPALEQRPELLVGMQVGGGLRTVRRDIFAAHRRALGRRAALGDTLGLQAQLADGRAGVGIAAIEHRLRRHGKRRLPRLDLGQRRQHMRLDAVLCGRHRQRRGGQFLVVTLAGHHRGQQRLALLDALGVDLGGFADRGDPRLHARNLRFHLRDLRGVVMMGDRAGRRHRAVTRQAQHHRAGGGDAELRTTVQAETANRATIVEQDVAGDEQTAEAGCKPSGRYRKANHRTPTSCVIPRQGPTERLRASNAVSQPHRAPDAQRFAVERQFWARGA